MCRLDDAISDVAYIRDALMAYRNIVDSGDCNRCGKKETCEFVPKPGQLVRYSQTEHMKMIFRSDQENCREQ